jgi:hypothetical protein
MKDKNGISLKLFDLVRIGTIPDHYWMEEEVSVLQEYAGCLGLISYPDERLYDYSDPRGSQWVNSNRSHVNVLCIRADGEHLSSYTFWLPTISIKKLHFNAVALAAFAQLPLDTEFHGQEHRWVFDASTEFYQLVSGLTRMTDECLEGLHHGVWKTICPS